MDFLDRGSRAVGEDGDDEWRVAREEGGLISSERCWLAGWAIPRSRKELIARTLGGHSAHQHTSETASANTRQRLSNVHDSDDDTKRRRWQRRWRRRHPFSVDSLRTDHVLAPPFPSLLLRQLLTLISLRLRPSSSSSRRVYTVTPSNVRVDDKLDSRRP